MVEDAETLTQSGYLLDYWGFHQFHLGERGTWRDAVWALLNTALTKLLYTRIPQLHVSIIGKHRFLALFFIWFNDVDIYTIIQFSLSEGWILTNASIYINSQICWITGKIYHTSFTNRQKNNCSKDRIISFFLARMYWLIRELLVDIDIVV